MAHVHDIIDADLLRERLDSRHINVQTHLTFPGYRIFNYAQMAQFDRVWDEATLQCRGLIIDQAGNILARPFRKFFNLEEVQVLPDGPFVAHEKMDGSLGIAYKSPGGGVYIATRGSFASDQAVWATQWLKQRPDLEFVAGLMIDQGLTPLFEIIYPDNRIVVNYQGREELVYLTAIDMATGKDVEFDWPGSRAAEYPGLDIDALRDLNIDNAEGFVLKWEDGTRLKVKFPEYVRLHRLLTGVTTRTIWELLSNRISLNQLMDVVPDEFFQWVKVTSADLKAQFTEIERTALSDYSRVPRDLPRKEQAEIVNRTKYPHIVFLMLDQREYTEKIWKLIRPAADKPFKVEQ